MLPTLHVQFNAPGEANLDSPGSRTALIGNRARLRALLEAPLQFQRQPAQGCIIATAKGPRDQCRLRLPVELHHTSCEVRDSGRARRVYNRV